MVNSLVNTGLNVVNSVLNTSYTSSDVAKGLDTAATVLDIGAAAISSAIAAGEVASAATGFISGAGVGFALGGEPAVATGPLGAAVGVGLFELSPEVRVAAALSDGMGWASTGFTALSDVITGDTNVTGPVSVSGGSMHVTQNSSIGRDTASTLFLSTLGQMAPLGVIDAPIDYVGLAFDAGLPWKIWPFSEVPESIPVTDIDVEIDY